MSEPRWVQVCATAEVLPGEMLGVWAEDVQVLVINHDGDFHALEDRCSHEDYELSAGALHAEDGSVECTLHGARFDFRNGEALCAPAYTPVRKFPVKVENSAVWVQLPAA